MGSSQETRTSGAVQTEGVPSFTSGDNRFRRATFGKKGALRFVFGYSKLKHAKEKTEVGAETRTEGQI